MSAIAKLRACLERMDSFGAPSDDCPVYVDSNNCLFELVPDEEGAPQFKLGDLRDLVKEFDDNGK
jgi:hypothetical protein